MKFNFLPVTNVVGWLWGWRHTPIFGCLRVGNLSTGTRTAATMEKEQTLEISVRRKTELHTDQPSRTLCIDLNNIIFFIQFVHEYDANLFWKLDLKRKSHEEFYAIRPWGISIGSALSRNTNYRSLINFLIDFPIPAIF
jgi:hypothetical protein